MRLAGKRSARHDVVTRSEPRMTRFPSSCLSCSSCPALNQVTG
jgi:hypothetical protein